MQSTVKFFQLPAQNDIGGMSGKKIAVKMSAKDAAAMDENAGRFAEMMAALMALPEDRMAQPLSEGGWSFITEEGAKEWVPLIDLSDSDGTGPDMMVQMLMHQTENKNGEHGFFKLKINAHPGGVGDQAAAIDPNAAETVMGKTATGEETLSPELKNAILASASQGQTQEGETPELNAELMQPKKTDVAASEKVIDTETKSKGAENRQALFANDDSDEFSEPETLQSMVQKSHRKPGSHGAENKAASQAQPNPQMAQEGKNVNGEEGQGRQQPPGEVGRRHPDIASADTMANVLSDSGTSSSQAQTGTTANDGAAPFQSHLKNITGAEAGSSKVAVDPPVDSKEMQTDVIRQIVQRMTLRTDGHTSQMQLKLKPEFLGNMRMDIITENQQVMIRMTAENHKVKDIIEQNIHLLKAEMQQQGLQVNKIDVQVSQDQDAWKNGQQQTAYQQAHERKRQRGGYQGDRRDSGADTPWTDRTTSNKAVGSKNSEVDFFA